MFLKDPMDDIILHSENSPDIQMTLQTDHFVDETFWGCNWSQAEQLEKNC